MTITDTPHVEIGARIKSARMRAGISQERLAPMAGTSRRHIMRLEKGLHRPGDELLERIAEATGQPIDFFRDEPGGDRASGEAA